MQELLQNNIVFIVMNLINIINEVISEVLSENRIWYHGTPDAREVNQNGSFVPRMGQLIVLLPVHMLTHTEHLIIRIPNQDYYKLKSIQMEKYYRFQHMVKDLEEYVLMLLEKV